MRTNDGSKDLVLNSLPLSKSAEEAKTITDEEITKKFFNEERKVWMRPHVLWFDESYDEHLFKFQSSLKEVEETDMLIVVGTTGTTNLPYQMISEA